MPGWRLDLEISAGRREGEVGCTEGREGVMVLINRTVDNPFNRRNLLLHE